MRESTKNAIMRMSNYPWLEHVGKPINAIENVITVNSWADALIFADLPNWKSAQLQISNYCARCVHAANFKRYSDWNNIVGELKYAMEEPLLSKIRNYQVRNNIDHLLLDCVAWDVAHILLGLEFDDVVPPFFFVPVLNSCYASGHFPCGWTGPILDTKFDGQMPDFELYAF